MKSNELLISALLLSPQWAMATLDPEIRINLEEPAKEHNAIGISNLRGWAVGPTGIERIELYVDGTYRFDIPYGGKRQDVGYRFSAYPDADRSGFSATFNYGQLAIDRSHEFRVRAVDALGNYNDSSVEVPVHGFADPYIDSDQALSLDGAEMQIIGNDIWLWDTTVDDEPEILKIEWDKAKQRPAISAIYQNAVEAEIRRIDGLWEFDMAYERTITNVQESTCEYFHVSDQSGSWHYEAWIDQKGDEITTGRPFNAQHASLINTETGEMFAEYAAQGHIGASEITSFEKIYRFHFSGNGNTVRGEGEWTAYVDTTEQQGQCHFQMTFTGKRTHTPVDRSE